MTHERSNTEMAACAQICMGCAQVCGEAITTCLTDGKTLIDKELIGCLMDCMAICQTSSSLLMRSSPNHVITCQAVAEITERCAKNCERFSHLVLQRCAEECRGCAASCCTMVDEAHK